MNKTQDQFPAKSGFKDVYKLNQGSGSFVAFNENSRGYEMNTTSQSGFFAENLYGKSQGAARKFRPKKLLAKIEYPDELDTQYASSTIKLEKEDFEAFMENKKSKV